MFALESRVDAQLLRSGNLADSDWEKLIEGAGTIGDPVFVPPDGSTETMRLPVHLIPWQAL